MKHGPTRVHPAQAEPSPPPLPLVGKPALEPAGRDGLFHAALLVIVAWGVSAARPFLVPVCIAVLLAFLIAPFARLLRRIQIPEWVAVVASALLLLAPLFGLGYVGVIQGQALARDLPNLIGIVFRHLRAVSASPLGMRLHLAEVLGPNGVASWLTGAGSQGIQVAISGITAVLGVGSQVALILLFTILMLASRENLRNGAQRVLGAPRNAHLIDSAAALIERFLVVRLLIALFVAAVDMAILAGFGLSYSVLMSLFLGVMTVVPAIGFVIGAIPPVLVSASTGHRLLATAFLLGLLTAVSFIEANILSPRFIGRRLDLSALTVFLGFFAGGLLWGVWGMLLSIPLIAIARIWLAAVPGLEPWGDLLSGRSEASNPARYPPGNGRFRRSRGG